MHTRLNEPISEYAMKLLSMYIDFPEGEPITAVDFRARKGTFLNKLTEKHKGPKHLYAVEEDYLNAALMRESGDFEKVSNARYNEEKRISKDAFSLAIIDPIVSRTVASELFDSIDTFVEPDYEKIETERLRKEENKITTDEIDFGAEELTEEELLEKEEAFHKKLEKAIKERRLAYRRALRVQEKRISLTRTDNYLLRMATEHLMPGGILVMVTPKELIDTSITIRLANQFENIQILRLEENEYLESRKCIIIAQKKTKNKNQDRALGYELAETKLTPYKEIEEIAPQIEPMFLVPSQKNDAVNIFRVGPLTSHEALDAVKKSNLLENYQEKYAQVLTKEEPITPTPLHKGHIMLLLTSGYLDGYIGKGVNQHLVKGSAIKMTRETTERDNQGVEEVIERDYYNISVKYLNSKGEFHTLM